MKKITAFLFLTILTTLSSRATVLFEDSSNYPYANGCIETQGQWYAYSPKTPNLNTFVTNNIIYLVNNKTNDEVAAPTNGWDNSSSPYIHFASFQINVSQLPSTANGGFFFQFQDNQDTNNGCHVFIDTLGTTVPGTFRLGIANFSTSFTAPTPPVNYPLDLATGVTYTVVVAFDNNPYATFDPNPTDPLLGATLWINPSHADFENAVNGSANGTGFIYNNDTTVGSQLNMQASQIGFSPYISAGISNVIAAVPTGDLAAGLDEVNSTNPPVFGVQPQSETTYSGNNTTFYSAASGVDLAYQWYSTISGALHDGANIVGSTSNILVINNLSASDTYYVVVTDTYGSYATSTNAVNTVITTPTPVFSPSSVSAANITNYLFVNTGFTNTALGTGPIYYQWYFAPTNNSSVYAPLAGQTSASLNLYLADYTLAGNYFVVASNTISGTGYSVFGPTNSLTELAPLIASLPQLHAFLLGSSQYKANFNTTYYINTNNLQVGGYVTTYGGFGNSYSTFLMQDQTGFGVEVYAGASTPGWTGPAGNTNVPPIGSYVTVSGPLESYYGGLEITPLSAAAIQINSNVPPIILSPRLANANFNDYVTNTFGSNALNAIGSLVAFTNVYLYGTSAGGAIGNNGNFKTNAATSALYFTVGAPYHSPDHTNTMKCYQYDYNYSTTNNSFGTTNNPFNGVHIPTNCVQLTGVFYVNSPVAELLPSRPVDYCTNIPVPFPVAFAVTNNGKPIINWTNIQGLTYSVYSSTSLSGPWTQAAYGFGYYPTNCTFTDTNTAGSAKFYKISTP